MFVLTRGHTPPSLTQAMYVDQCLAQDRLKSAFQAVQNFGLVEEYPNVEAMYRQKTVGKLLGKRLWAVASKVVGNDVALQGMVIKQVSLEAKQQAQTMRGFLILHTLTGICFPSPYTDD